jgi:hypothetical protein
MEDVAKRENPNTAVVPWGEYERRIVEAYGHASIQHVITVLYRYNTVRNDFVDLKIIKIQRRRLRRVLFYEHDEERANPQRKKAGDTALLISSTATDQRCH